MDLNNYGLNSCGTRYYGSLILIMNSFTCNCCHSMVLLCTRIARITLRRLVIVEHVHLKNATHSYVASNRT